MPEGCSVSELCASIDAAVSHAFPDEVWVKGAISGLNRSANGHVYFDLVEPGELGGHPTAVLPVALFASNKFRVNAILKKTNAVRMRDGIEIQIRGRVAYYARQGRVQLLMSLIDPAFTLGQLEQAKAELLAELGAAGLLDANRGVPFPTVPLRVALITSAGSAAEADFVTELLGSGIEFEITHYDSRVQGDDAVDDLASAISAAGTPDGDGRTRHDVIAVVRGGGARTDLVAFDHRRVAFAVARSPLPVVVGIGHEIDRSVVDEVAARSVKTPTACARLLVEEVRRFSAQVDAYAERIERAAHLRLQQADAAVGRAERHVAQRTERRLLGAAHRVETLSGRLGAATRRRFEGEDNRLAVARAVTDAADPRRILARGFAVIHSAEGTLVRSPADVAPGDTVRATLADGDLVATITDADTSPTVEEPADD